MRKLFFLFVALLATTSLWAHDFEVDGIYYNYLDGNNVGVTCRGHYYDDYDNEYAGAVIIPETVTYNGTTYSVTSIGNWAFYDCSSLTSVTIPNSVTSIGDYTFSGCSSLTSVTIPNSVTSIGESAFRYCSSLTSVTIPNSVTSIGNWAFSGCSSLTSVTIPNSVTSIGEKAFYGCSSLTSVTIPNSVTSIGEMAFYGCSSLTSVTIPNSVTSIGNWAFHDCDSLILVTINSNAIVSKDYSNEDSWRIKNLSDIFGSQVTEYIIGNSVTRIGKYAFWGCRSLTSVTIPNSVTCIETSAFETCSSLRSVAIPNSVTRIDWGAFENCSSLSSVTINSNAIVSTYYSSYSNMSDIFGEQVTEYIIGDDVNSIGNWAFEDCSSLTSVTIPNSVTSIGYRAFSGCSSLTSVTIPNSITSIGDYTFYDCSGLTTITCKAATPPTVGYKAFEGVSKSIPVNVPCGCATAYKAAYGWGDFANIQAPLDYSIKVNVNDSIMGTAKVDYNTPCEGGQISATPNLGYHFVRWSDGNTDNPRTLVLIQDTILTAEFAQSFSGQCGDSLYWELIDIILHITGSGAMYDYTPDSIPWKLLVSSIKELTIAEDVTSIDGEAFSSCSALDSVVWNAKKCADFARKENAPFYDIRSQIKSFTFGEAVEHIPASLCSEMDKLTSITIPNSVTSIGNSAFKDCSSLTSMTTPNSLKTIGTSAFEGCARLSKISFGIGLEEIAANAFAGCTRLYDIYLYATYPPFAEESSFANYNVYVYIPCEYQRAYILDVVWGKFKFIECIESEEATTDGNVTVVPGSNDVTITWPTEDNADNYAIVIEKDGEVFCTLTFNADGQLLNIAFAPSRDSNNRPAQYAEQAVNGYRFTVTGLTEATRYAYNITTKDTAKQTIATYSGEFTTLGGTVTSVENILQSTTNPKKLLIDGQLYIVKDGKTYNAMGQKM